MYRNSELLNKAELSAVLNVGPDTISEWIEERGFPYLTRGKDVYFLRDDVDRWILSQNNPSPRLTDDDIPTEQLIVKLLEAKNIDSFIQIYQRRLVRSIFHDYISDLAQRMNLSKAEVIRRANLSESYGYQLFKGTRIPSRESVIALAFGFGTDIVETQKLLKAADERFLYPKIPREAVIYYCIEHGESLSETQEKLKALSMPLIGGERDE